MSWDERRRKLRAGTVGRAFLWTLSMLYGAGAVLHRLAYAAGLRRTRKAPPQAKVVCVGNLTAGGTGKTPAVLLAAQTLRRRNHNVAILTRGYGRKGDGIVVLSDDKEVAWEECGDEPWMMQRTLHGQHVPILVSADRHNAAVRATEFFGSKVLILDDGFQHHKFHRDLDVVLINATDPWGGGALLPLGNLREPRSALKRAHIVMLTRVDLVSESQLETLRAEVRQLNAAAALLEAVHKADFLLDARTGARLKLDHLEGKEVAVLSGLGDPTSFETQVERCGAAVKQRWRFADHHRYVPADLEAAEKLRGGRPLVTTFKDLARFPAGWQTVLGGDVHVLAVRLEIVKGRNVWTDRLVALAGEPVTPLRQEAA